jgi:hypothetical protein
MWGITACLLVSNFDSGPSVIPVYPYVAKEVSIYRLLTTRKIIFRTSESLESLWSTIYMQLQENTLPYAAVIIMRMSLFSIFMEVFNNHQRRGESRDSWWEG